MQLLTEGNYVVVELISHSPKYERKHSKAWVELREDKTSSEGG
jgi:hypothetical protein